LQRITDLMFLYLCVALRRARVGKMGFLSRGTGYGIRKFPETDTLFSVTVEIQNVPHFSRIRLGDDAVILCRQPIQLLFCTREQIRV
jgi:hypothetical protein